MTSPRIAASAGAALIAGPRIRGCVLFRRFRGGHEHARVCCPALRPEPAQRRRLDGILASLPAVGRPPRGGGP